MEPGVQHWNGMLWCLNYHFEASDDKWDDQSWTLQDGDSVGTGKKKKQGVLGNSYNHSKEKSIEKMNQDSDIGMERKK